MAAQRFVTDEVIRFILDIVGDGVKSNKENTSSEEGMPCLTQSMSNVLTVTNQRKCRGGDAVFNPAHVKRTDGDQPEEKVEEVNGPSTSRGRGCGRWIKCDVVVEVEVVAVGG